MHARIALSTNSPFRLDLTVWALRRRKANAVDRWDGRQYSRIIVFDDEPVRLIVTQKAAGIGPALQVTARSRTRLSQRTKEEIASTIQTMLGLTVDLKPFYELVHTSDRIQPLVEQFLGVRPPRFPSIFEGLVNSIACQQMTLDLGILLLNRLAERFGTRFVDQDCVLHAFPAPADLADAPEGSIRTLGFSRQKARATRELAARLADNALDLSRLDGMTDNDAAEWLSTIRGIGRWSAEYVLLRGLGRLGVFPGDDVGAQNNIRRLFDLDARPKYGEIKELTSQWRPYEGVVYFHLLLERLRAKGMI
jgi:DNA-3-methyladenine glycosylase II